MNKTINVNDDLMQYYCKTCVSTTVLIKRTLRKHIYSVYIYR